MNKILFFALTGGLAIIFAALPILEVQAQDKRKHIGGYRDWEAFVDEDSRGTKMCYAISTPKETLPKGANRGEIFVMVTHIPGLRIKDQTSTKVGYPFRGNSEATAIIGGQTFTMFTENQEAWMYTERDDTAAVGAMKRGNSMTVRGTSARGTKTSDRYSLLGFTDAYNAMTSACAS